MRRKKHGVSKEKSDANDDSSGKGVGPAEQLLFPEGGDLFYLPRLMAPHTRTLVRQSLV
jgi:hypothetical protein